ncbi:MAG: GNAT family N-acetyltransferase [Pseudodesulfovibrio sp.]|uniref:N-acetyltransferase domain-containing protein n=1 Tax=Pseudodesulfovibrio aespoeensis (strain ATCC 700646 / DSM 10631 / Aspo-2) TaxID=643562 RepID=E6VY37_PSEA9|nr:MULTISPECIES: GNAT family N-acetyltransferase [Pseudodesulfovibrio]MBU4192736.1 GNAT family N-acetyltransferase [Pseudomonadota bacterium]ADU63851.1 hypothetical protein Daes_2855 [Pseudodesulfovibrio aespoeensis Aspo-2]MBU4243803.1 GNAT family N-acetyltransferase [Pseudomonadota bacterium]MBU4379976.1 GNAT family N-acetyltransferase [Pseudomonadota bacterium]MBU4475274.1 GNAT family N-acetyltransferase [Pseudomonadota bacterium]
MIEPGQEVTVGLFRPEDALGVCLAYLETYGDAFPIEHVYDPAEVIRRNATDDQHTIVARTPRGEVVGLAGLFRHAPNPEVYEVGQLMVLRQYRASRLGAAIIRLAIGVLPRELGVPVVFGEAVCNHPASQRLVSGQGLACTGLAVECMPANAYEVEGGVVRNVSLLFMFSVHVSRPCAICVPAPYSEIIGELCDRFGLVRSSLAPRPLTGATEWTEFLLPEAGLSRLTVSRAGADFGGVVAGAEGRAETVQAYLNLGDPGVAEAVALLRGRGYFFGGLLPHWFGPDGLVMQRTGQEPDWDAMRLDGEKAMTMRDFVRHDREGVAGPHGTGTGVR